MTALRQSALSDAIRNEVARLKGAGFPLLPLGGGADGKTPLTRAWAGPVMPLRQIFGPMHRSGSCAYGVRLDGLAVIDCDTDDSNLTATLEARFGASPVHVKTPRGLHLYYRAAGAVPNLRGEGLPVDIKTGGRAYVVGPLSVRPDGGFYAPAKGLLGVNALPLLRAATWPLVGNATIQEGQRHNTLVKRAMQMVEFVDSAEELTANLYGLRDDLCGDPSTMPDSELRDIAHWAWKCRLEGKIFSGRDSDFRLNRMGLDALRGKPGGSDATALLVLLTDMHGHAPGKRFALAFEEMRRAGLTDLTVARLRDARRMLEAAGLLQLVGNHRAGSAPQAYRLTRMRPGVEDAVNVERLSSQPIRRGKG
jgi:hypothetical protein